MMLMAHQHHQGMIGDCKVVTVITMMMNKVRLSTRRQRPHVLLLALCLALLVLPGCQMALGPFAIGGGTTPTLPVGWTWYHDSAFPFDAPVPPGWQAHGYWNWTDASNKECQRKVDLVPPVTQPAYAQNPYNVRPFSELVTIVVADMCSDFVPSVDNPSLKLAGHVQIGSAHGSLYTQIDTVGDEHVAITRLGGRQYVFTFYYQYGTATPQAHAPTELKTFNTMLNDFVYRGK